MKRYRLSYQTRTVFFFDGVEGTTKDDWFQAFKAGYENLGHGTEIYYNQYSAHGSFSISTGSDHYAFIGVLSGGASAFAIYYYHYETGTINTLMVSEDDLTVPGFYGRIYVTDVLMID